MHVFTLAESAVTNSLGRAISLSLVAAEVATVELWALDDGPTWTGARHFDLPVNRFAASRHSGLTEAIRKRSATEPVVVWISKGLAPLDRIARDLRTAPGVTLVADFDDDDVSLMREQMRKSVKTAAHLNVTHRKSPARVRRSQLRTAGAADAYTFSSVTVGEAYRRFGLPQRPSAVIPHTRPTRWLVADRGARRPGPLRLAYLGTVRPHKGADRILALVEAMPEVEFSCFSDSLRPAAAGARWHTVGTSAALPEVYADLDFTLVPQNPASSAARNQLPSKIVEAAAFGVAVVATPTPVIEEYCAGAYVAIEDWSDPEAVAARIRAADPAALGSAIRRVFVERFAAPVSAGAFSGLLGGTPAGG